MKKDDISDKVLCAEYEAVFRYTLSLCHNGTEAEDITQEAFLKALNARQSFQGGSSLYTWLCSIAKNVWINKCKKEYNLIAEELPKVNTITTKDKFAQVVKQQKLKKRLSILFAILIGCAMTMGGIYILCEAPLKAIPKEDINIIQTYVAQTEQGSELFIWYETPYYMYKSTLTGKSDSNSDVLQFDLIDKVPLLATPEEDLKFESIVSFGLENNAGDVDEITFNNEIIWSATTNGDDEIPPYVYEYSNFNHEARTVVHDYKQGFIGIGYDNADMTYWDLEGNVISEKTIQLD